MSARAAGALTYRCIESHWPPSRDMTRLFDRPERQRAPSPPPQSGTPPSSAAAAIQPQRPAAEPRENGPQVVLDEREHKLIEAATAVAAPFGAARWTVERLDVGDVAIRDQKGADLLLFERKTWMDLLSSLTDGRYKDQKHRLARFAQINPGCHVGYLIEGSFPRERDFKRTGMSNAHVNGQLLSISLGSAQPVLYSPGISGTLALLKSASIRLAFDTGNPRSLRKSNRAVVAQPIASAPPEPPRLSRTEAATGTSSAVWLRQLMCVRGVSLAVARILARHAKGPRALAKVLKVQGTIAGITRQRSSGRKTGAPRKLGSALEQRLAEAFATA